MNWNRDMLNGVCLFLNSCLKSKNGRNFCIALWPRTKDGFVTITRSVEDYVDISTKFLRHWSNRISRLQRYGVYLVAAARCSVSWVIKIVWNNYRRSLPNAIHAYDSIKWFFSMTRLAKWSKHTWKRPIPPSVLPTRCSLWLSFVSIDGTQPDWKTLLVLWKSQTFDHLKSFFDVRWECCLKNGRK